MGWAFKQPYDRYSNEYLRIQCLFHGQRVQHYHDYGVQWTVRGRKRDDRSAGAFGLGGGRRVYVRGQRKTFSYELPSRRSDRAEEKKYEFGKRILLASSLRNSFSGRVVFFGFASQSEHVATRPTVLTWRCLRRRQTVSKGKVSECASERTSFSYRRILR